MSQFLDNLSNRGASATGIGDLHTLWRKTLEAATWAHIFLEAEQNPADE